MRNLKRALSMAMASVMLMGMSVVGTSAASVSDFSDVDSINNLEAVSIATGLGIFEGFPDGEFKPEQVVTRAQMAVVIAKILHGADVDPSIFVGESQFTDVDPWAEGYVNLVAALGIIEGYGDGKFGPNDPVTTVQANIMLLKALGYYTAEGDELPNTWADAQLQATSKATALGFFGDKALKMDQGLTREDVAELTFNALFAQRVAYDDVRGLHVKANNRNVVVTNGTVDHSNTLAENTFGLYKVEGVVTANSMTDINLIPDSTIGAQTTVQFAEDVDVNLDGRTDGTAWTFEYETGLDMIGHASKVYYKVVKGTPVVYAITDNAVKAELTYVDTDKNISAVASKAGFNRDTRTAAVVENYVLNSTVTYGDYAAGTPVLMVANENDLIVDYAIVLNQQLDYVEKITINNADPENPIATVNFDVETSKKDDTNLIVADEITEGEYVILTKVTGRGATGSDLFIAAKAPTQTEMLTVVDRTYNTTDKLSSASETYKKATVTVDDDLVADGIANPTVTPVGLGTETEDYKVTPYASVALAGEYNLVFDNFGRLIAVADPAAKSDLNIAYVAQFGHKINTDPSLNDAYRLTAHVYFADGTNGVYYVDTATKQNNDFYKWKVSSAGVVTKADGTTLNVGGAAPVAGDLNYLPDADEAFGAYIKLWDVTVDEEAKTVVLDAQINDADNDATTDAVSITNHKKNVTYLGKQTGSTDGVAYNVYANNETVFFYVDGKYTENADSAECLTVGVVTGISNISNLDVTGDPSNLKNDEKAQVVDMVSKPIKKNGATNYVSAQTVLIEGEELAGTLSGIYFYNGKYTITRVGEKQYSLTYHLYDITANENAKLRNTDAEGYVAYTFEKLFKSYTDAEVMAQAHGAGFYKFNAKDLKAVYSMPAPGSDEAWAGQWIPNPDGTSAEGDKNAYVAGPDTYAVHGDVKYVVNTNFVKFENFGHNVTLYTGVNYDQFGLDATNAEIVNLTTYENIDSLADLDAAVEAHQKSLDDAGKNITAVAKLSYVYNTKTNVVDTIYVMSITAPVTIDNGSNGVDTTGTYTIDADTADYSARTNYLTVKVKGDKTLGAEDFVTFTVTVEERLGGAWNFVDSEKFTVYGDASEYVSGTNTITLDLVEEFGTVVYSNCRVLVNGVVAR